MIENQTPLSPEGPEFEELKGEKTRGSIARWIVEVEKGSFRAPNDETQTTLPYELDQLKKWYADFILPIIDLIPKNGERITFIPDAFLHEAPFALFLDGNGKFLFETCTPSVAPSIETLLHINQLNKKNTSSRTHGTLCMVASPKPHEDFALDELPGVATEKIFTTKFFKSFSDVSPVVKEVKESLSLSENIHIASHGMSKAKENEHSVFEGALALTDPLPLYAEDIVHLPLNAELAFLSACSSGNGKKFKEGSIGLPFAFLAGGASSVIATRWNINDVATPEIVENFYQHYFGLSKEAQIARFENKPFGQAEALRHAMLFGKKTYSDRPKVWGAFFLNGLPGNIFQHDPVPDDKHPKPIIWENQDQRLLFSLKGKTIITTLINKKSGDRSDFEEKNVIVCMKNTVQVKGTIQDKRPLDELQLAEKQQVINFLVFRVIVIEGKNICITSRLRS